MLVVSGLEDSRRRAHWHRVMWEKSGETPKLGFEGLMVLSCDAMIFLVEVWIRLSAGARGQWESGFDLVVVVTNANVAVAVKIKLHNFGFSPVETE